MFGNPSGIPDLFYLYTKEIFSANGWVLPLFASAGTILPGHATWRIHHAVNLKKFYNEKSDSYHGCGHSYYPGRRMQLKEKSNTGIA